MNGEKNISNKKEANLFEKRILTEAALQGITADKFQETIRGVFRGKPVYVKSNVDFAIGADGRYAKFDAKVTRERLWNLKKYVFHPDKIHQTTELVAAHGNGNRAGYLIWFQEYRVISWVPIEVLTRCQKQGVLSITPETEGIVSQDENEMIRLRELIWNDQSKQV